MPGGGGGVGPITCVTGEDCVDGLGVKLGGAKALPVVAALGVEGPAMPLVGGGDKALKSSAGRGIPSRSSISSTLSIWKSGWCFLMMRMHLLSWASTRSV